MPWPMWRPSSGQSRSTAANTPTNGLDAAPAEEFAVETSRCHWRGLWQNFRAAFLPTGIIGRNGSASIAA